MIRKLFDYAKSRTHGAIFQVGFVPLADVSKSKLESLYAIDSGGLTFASFANGLFKFAIALGAIAALLRIAYAGYLYMGTEAWTNKGKAKEILTDVAIGLLLLLSIYLILNQINPDILQLQALKF